MIFAPFTLILFLANHFLIRPDRPVNQNLLSAAISGVVFVVIMTVYNKMRRK